MGRKLFRGWAVAAILTVTVPVLAWALNADYNRPLPRMDYVPQEIGMYDTMYAELTEDQCRACHGASLGDRHHNTDFVLVAGSCEPCHDLIDEAPGVVVFRNCIVDEGVVGCHSWDNARLGINGWHHETASWDEPDSCVTCHNPNLVGPIRNFRPFALYPPSVVTPTPFSCENCHWEQVATAPAGGDPFDNTTNEHPLDKNHYNVWGQPMGYFEYGTDIKGNYDTHHMGVNGNVASQCANCHFLDPNDPDWDPANPELIRYCQVCHDVGTLHTLKTLYPGFPGGALQPHVGDYYAWEATGFHDPDAGDIPSTYRQFSANEQCFGCHADLIPWPPWCDDCWGYRPAIHYGAVSPKSGACYTYVRLRGENFGEEQFEDSFVQMRKSDSDPWTNVPVYSWTETQIEFEIPCGAFEKGNYRIRVQQSCGYGNQVGFALKDWGTLLSVVPRQSPCSTWLTLTGSGFGGGRSYTTTTVGETGVERFVKLVGPEGEYIVKRYRNWTDTQVEARFYNLSQDDNGDYIEDAPIKKCNGSVSTWLGSYEVYFVTVYYEENGTAGFDAGDTIYQVTISDPSPMELTPDPVVFRLNADEIANRTRLKVRGQNFGDLQGAGEIRIGTKAAAENPALAQGKLLDKNVIWSNTVLKVKLKVPTKWQGKTKYVWVEKDGKKSNFKRVNILAPE
jgi:hypothetical protein